MGGLGRRLDGDWGRGWWGDIRMDVDGKFSAVKVSLSRTWSELKER
jgi:hypothetical protein